MKNHVMLYNHVSV